MNYTMQYERTKDEVQVCHEFELVALFRNWLYFENYEGCQWIKELVDTRLAANTLDVRTLVDGFRNGRTGECQIDQKGWLNGLLDGIRAKHPQMFTPAAALSYAKRIPANAHLR